jgi:mono/diheme cytochrome c family protein
MKRLASPSLQLSLIVLSSAALSLSIGCSSSSTPSPKDAAADHSGNDGSPSDTSTAGADGSASDGSASDGNPDVASDTVSMSDGSHADGSSLTPTQARGQYLTGVFGCVNCHTPKLTGGVLDTANLFAGVDCTADTSGNCLSDPNLTPDNTGIGLDSDQQVIDAFRTGRVPQHAVAATDGGADAAADAEVPDSGADGGFPATYLFATMPYYQFANLTDADAQAIVAYLRSLRPVAHTPKANAGTFATPLTAPQWTPADPAKLPAPAADASADAANGKYFATLLCATCHTANLAGADGGTASPLHIDETKAFQGGKTSSITVDGGVMTFQASNLTPDTTGIKDWSAMELVTAIRTAKDKTGKTLCAPMRANASLTSDDATAIADYLLSLTPVANTVNAGPARL